MQEGNKGWQNGQKNLSDFVITGNCPKVVLQVRNQNVRGINSIARETKREIERERRKARQIEVEISLEKVQALSTKKKKSFFFKKEENCLTFTV